MQQPIHGPDFWRDLVRLGGTAGRLGWGRVFIFGGLAWLLWLVEVLHA